ncbi:hypothetical protein K438DRAFT_1983705 [Mycena galopus ATCC 62051]|nr:hypothetical protein K438DRAFT_1983705 [Mycena galopus ATCC 62051]
MPRIRTIIFQALGHVPFPLDPPRTRWRPRRRQRLNEHVKLVFRNRGGRPTFQVRGAEIGVSSADAWGLETVVNAVIHGRNTRAQQGGLQGTPRVRVKVEEGTPRIPAKRNGKGKERQERVTDGDANTQYYAMRSVSGDALVRGSLTWDCFEEVYQVEHEDFAFALDPSLPVARPLTEAEWRRLWAALFRMDHFLPSFWVPDPDTPQYGPRCAKARSEEMVEAAAGRVHAGLAEPHRRRLMPQAHL